MNYLLSIWYAGMSDEDDPQTHVLDRSQAELYVRPETGFLHDLLTLEGQGVRKLSLEVLIPLDLDPIPRPGQPPMRRPRLSRDARPRWQV